MTTNDAAVVLFIFLIGFISVLGLLALVSACSECIKNYCEKKSLEMLDRKLKQEYKQKTGRDYNDDL